YRQVVDILSSIEAPGGTIDEIVQICANNCLKLRSVMATCDKHGISTKTLIDGIDLRQLLEDEECRAVFNDISGLSVVSALDNFCSYLVQQTGKKQRVMQGPIICAQRVFMQNFDSFKAEVDNEKLLQEIQLDTLRFENVNKKQLAITIRNTYITLAGVIITALLTIANII
ncbi:hypothetical protein BGZ80_007228, partial [Entomortierella chlamydospora]